MNRIKNSLTALAGILALIGVIAALTPSATRGQSGSTPSKDVSVVNTPTVNLAESAKVGIDPARNKVKLDDSAREPLMISLGEFQLVDDQAAAYRTGRFQVPEGKRLVVEHVYGTVYVTGVSFEEFLLRSGAPGQPSEHTLPLPYTPQPPRDGGIFHLVSFTQPVKFYVANQAGDGVSVGVDIFAIGIGAGNRSVYLAGYLEPLP